MLKFGVKVGLTAGTIYYISEQGVWRDSEQTSQLCNKISTNISPYTQQIKKQIPYELPSLPETNELTYLAKFYWNRGVINSFTLIANIPVYCSEYATKGLNLVMDNTDIQNLFVDTTTSTSPEGGNK